MPIPSRLACLTAVGLMVAGCGRLPAPGQATSTGAPPRIDPDYTSTVMPPNIAPLNFRIAEEGQRFAVRILSEGAPPLEVDCPGGTCQIDIDDWRALLSANRGKELHYDVYAKKSDGIWAQYQRFTNTVAQEPIDSYIVFRQLLPNKQTSSIRGIFQRSLETFEREALVTLRDGTFTCFNCHTFHQHDPNRFLIHIRGKHAGMLLVMDGEMHKIDTKREPMFRPLAYASWHPDGRHIAATINMFAGEFPATADRYYFQAIEKRGDLVVYDVVSNTISTTQVVFNNEYVETHPYWSYDGMYIYFVRGQDKPLVSHQDMAATKFDMVRLSYDVATDTWGDLESVMAYSEIGKSCAYPRPDASGRYVLHILSDKSTYPIHQQSSDLYLLNLETKQYRRLDPACSNFSESYPKWSSNGRWFSFLSNRRDGMSALPYFAYFDEEGQAHKAFLLPQEDPAWYDTFTDTYNILELVRSRVDVDTFELALAMQQPARQAEFPNPPEVDAYTGATWSPRRLAPMFQALANESRQGQAVGGEGTESLIQTPPEKEAGH